MKRGARHLNNTCQEVNSKAGAATNKLRPRSESGGGVKFQGGRAGRRGVINASQGEVKRESEAGKVGKPQNSDSGKGEGKRRDWWRGGGDCTQYIQCPRNVRSNLYHT